MRVDEDTIVAIATAAGRAGVGVVRISGAAAMHIAAQLCPPKLEPRRASVRRFVDAQGSVLDEGVAILFPGPRSFTGEDVLELHGHGSPIVLDLLVARATELGARLAQPGEFSRRAYLNDKLDLTQAEAIADLIDSSSVQAARAAMRSLQGEFSHAIHELVSQLIEARMFVEAAIDFPEEEVDFLSDNTLLLRLKTIALALDDVLTRAEQGAALRQGYKVVIAGRPNAGKSSLMNRLAGYDAAIVTNIAGTTRDVLRERINIDGVVIELADTAGLRENADVIEAEGIRRATQELATADHVLYVIDAQAGLSPADLERALALVPSARSLTLVLNKTDLPNSRFRYEIVHPQIAVSATTGAGVNELRQHLKDAAGWNGSGENVISARRRHLDALIRARTHLRQAERQLSERRAGELVAEELRQAQTALNEITGEFTSDDLLGRIFSSFCIGK